MGRYDVQLDGAAAARGYLAHLVGQATIPDVAVAPLAAAQAHAQLQLAFAAIVYEAVEREHLVDEHLGR